MGSLALLVAVVVLSLWALAAGSVLFSLLGFRRVGLALGFLSAAAGVWLLCALPHVPLLSLINIACGVVAIRRHLSQREVER